jgi:hypothetical protein
MLKSKLFSAHMNSFKIEIIWIPSHRGIIGNEIVDSLASSTTGIGVSSSAKIPHTDFYQSVKKKAKHCFAAYVDRWKNRKGTKYFNLFYNQSSKPWFSNLPHLDRKLITIACRIRSGHYNLNASLHRVNIVNSARCKCGFSSEDIDHVLWSCPLLSTHRIKFINLLLKA